jgi:hypothetical protein
MNVRTLSWLAVPLAVVAVAAPATAAPRAAKAKPKPKPRTVSAPYKTPGGVAQVISGGSYVNGDTYGAAFVETKRGDQTVTVSLADDHSKVVAFGLGQDADGDGRVETELGDFCGKTTSPVRLAKAGAELVVYVLAGQCGSGTDVSTPTTGTATVTIYGG